MFQLFVITTRDARETEIRHFDAVVARDQDVLTFEIAVYALNVNTSFELSLHVWRVNMPQHVPRL